MSKFFFKQFTFTEKLLLKVTWKHRIQNKLYHSVQTEIPVTNLAAIKRSLQYLHVPFVEGHACVTSQFPLCTDSNVAKCKIYINKTTGFFMCEKCKYIGPWSTLEQFFQLNKTKKPSEKLDALRESMDTLPDFNADWKQLRSTTEPIKGMSASLYKEIAKKFNLEHMEQDVLGDMDTIYEKSSVTLIFPLYAFSNLIVGYKTLSIASEDAKTVPNFNACGVIIYKRDNVKLDSSAVVVPSIEDLLALASAKAANQVICLPYGLQSIPQQILPSLESYKKLILWFGNDEQSWGSVRHFAKKLDEKRCYFVRPVDHQPRPKLAASSGYNLKKIIEEAQPIWHKSITSFRSLRQDVLSDLQNVDKVQGVKWSRFPALNTILKGHRRGELTVLTGPTGCGKTTFMSEYSLDLAMQGVNTLWGSFEIRNARLAKTMLQQMVCLPLEENLDKFDSYADEFEKLPIYFMTFHGQQNIKTVMETIEHATYVHDISHVVIDNVQFMMGMLDDANSLDRFWHQDKIIAAFRTFATKFNCHVTLVIHPRKEKEDGELTTSSIFGGAKATQEADNVLIIQDKRLNSIRGKMYLQVAKNRYSGELGIMVLDFDKYSLSYAAKKKSNIHDHKSEAQLNEQYLM